MKRPFYIIILCLICSMGHAQNSAKAKKFINEVITDKNINYQDSVDRETRAFMYEALKKIRIVYNYRKDSVDYMEGTKVTRMLGNEARKLVSDTKHFDRKLLLIVADSLVLTETEVVYANGEINKMRDYKWKSNLLPGAKLLSADSLSVLQKRWDYLRNNALTGLSKEERETRLKGLIEKAKKETTIFHKLSAPIFLRNDTYCLFYYGDDCINTLDWGCDSGNFMAYKKVNGKWVFWGDISFWMT